MMSEEVFTWADFDRAVDDLLEKMHGVDVAAIYGIPRGGLPLAVSLSHRLQVPILQTITDSIFYSGHILVVDDISDSGKTLQRIALPMRAITATIHITKHTDFIPDFHYVPRHADWVHYPWEA